MVIDANISLAWLFNEEGAAQIQKLLSELDLVAPWIWRIEVTNVILVRERRKLLSPHAMAEALRLIDEIQIDLVAESQHRSAAALAAFARPHQLTAYDALYLDLAIRLGLPLFTLDNNLRDAARRVGVPLIGEKLKTFGPRGKKM